MFWRVNKNIFEISETVLPEHPMYLYSAKLPLDVLIQITGSQLHTDWLHRLFQHCRTIPNGQRQSRRFLAHLERSRTGGWKLQQIRCDRFHSSLAFAWLGSWFDSDSLRWYTTQAVSKHVSTWRVTFPQLHTYSCCSVAVLPELMDVRWCLHCWKRDIKWEKRERDFESK